MADEKGQRRVRRSFTDDFKAGAVRLVLDEGKTVMQVARDLDLTASALRQWVERARADRSKGKTGLTSEERAELARLRKEVRELRMQRDILKKAAVRSTGRRNGRDLLSLVEVSAWRSSVGQVCRRSRRKNSGAGGGRGSRSVRLAGRWGSSLVRYTGSWPPTAVSPHTSELGVAELSRWPTARRSRADWSRAYPFGRSRNDCSERPRQ